MRQQREKDFLQKYRKTVSKYEKYLKGEKLFVISSNILKQCDLNLL